MRWKEPEARVVPALRALTTREDRSPQCWRNIDQYGFALAV